MAKKDIDFDVYQKANPESQVDWAKAAKDITQTFETIRDDRQTRKDEIERLFRERQEQLNEVDIYSNTSLQQMAITSSQEAGQKLTDFNNLVKRGLATEADNVLFNHNVKVGFDLFKKNAENFDQAFTEYANRTSGDLNAIQEQYIATMLEGFSNLNENKLSTNAETGEVAMLKLEPQFLEDGSKNPNAGRPIPNGGIGLQEMTVFMKQRIDKFDVGAAANKMSSEVGKYIIADLKTRGVKVADWEVEYNKMEQELVDNPKGLTILRDKAVQMLSNPQDKMDMLLRNSTTADGKSFKPGTEAEYEANGGDSNPNNEIIVFEKDSTGLMQPKFSEAQEDIAITYAEDQIKSTLSASRTVSVQKIQKTIQYPPEGYYRRLEKKERIQSLGRSVNMLVTGDKNAKESAAGELISRLDGLNDIKMDDNGNFFVYTTGNQPFEIKTGDKNVKEVIREIYNVVGDENVMGTADQYFDANGEVGPSVQSVVFEQEGVKPKVKYRTGLIFAADGKTKIQPSTLVYDKLGNELGMNDDDAEVQGEFQSLINNPYFFPQQLTGKINVSNATLSVNINGEDYVVATDIYGKNDNVKGLVNKLQLKIKEAVEGTSKQSKLNGQ